VSHHSITVLEAPRLANVNPTAPYVCTRWFGGSEEAAERRMKSERREEACRDERAGQRILVSASRQRETVLSVMSLLRRLPGDAGASDGGQGVQAADASDARREIASD
jgi:hypothetical protein